VTSNYPEKLNGALIRAGRIDHTVRFYDATQTQARDLFIRIYIEPGKMESSLSSAQGPVEEKAKSDSEIALLAEIFSKSIPEKRLSIAQLQNFLMRRREDPEKALNEVDSWVKEQLEEREEKEKKEEKKKLHRHHRHHLPLHRRHRHREEEEEEEKRRKRRNSM
jgi:chaperone BCS1